MCRIIFGSFVLVVKSLDSRGIHIVTVSLQTRDMSACADVFVFTASWILVLSPNTDVSL